MITSSQVIKFDCHDSADDCFISVLSHFLKRDQPPPTFSDLERALQSPPIDQSQLVDRIRELANKVCVCVCVCVCVSVCSCVYTLSVHVCINFHKGAFTAHYVYTIIIMMHLLH